MKTADGTSLGVGLQQRGLHEVAAEEQQQRGLGGRWGENPFTLGRQQPPPQRRGLRANPACLFIYILKLTFENVLKYCSVDKYLNCSQSLFRVTTAI